MGVALNHEHRLRFLRSVNKRFLPGPGPKEPVTKGFLEGSLCVIYSAIRETFAFFLKQKKTLKGAKASFLK